jgi:aminoglycoside phosphotransferase (APT) family kinase protein
MIDGIKNENVTNWLSGAIPELALPLNFSLITGGHSNLTFKCEDQNGAPYVLRRPPLGHVLESAHDMGREHRIISALQSSSVPVPRTIGLCKDIDVNDAPFYVMDYVEGTVLNTTVESQALTMDERRSIGLHVINILANLHMEDVDKVGLGDLGRKEAYLERQLKRWNKQWDATKTHPIPEMEESARLLAEKMPEQVGATIVHGDYRLGNMMVRDGSVKAILDFDTAPPTAVGGFPSRDELCDIYSEKTGRDLANINYYRAFSHWRLAAIGQGVYKRYLVGAMGEGHDVDLDKHKQGVSDRANAALELLI